MIIDMDYIVVYFKSRTPGCLVHGDVFIICVLREAIDDKKATLEEGNMKFTIYLSISNNH